MTGIFVFDMVCMGLQALEKNQARVFCLFDSSETRGSKIACEKFFIPSSLPKNEKKKRNRAVSRRNTHIYQYLTLLTLLISSDSSQKLAHTFNLIHIGDLIVQCNTTDGETEIAAKIRILL